MKHLSRRIRAMTAVELLAATALASLMLVSILGVLGGLVRQERLLRTTSVPAGWEERLSETVEWDLRNSEQYVLSRSGIRLTGYAGHDLVTDRPTGRPTLVEYVLVGRDAECCLVRREQELNARSNASWKTDLVCRGVERMEWGTVEVDQSSIPTSRPATAASSEPAKVPERVSLRLFGPQQREPFFDEILLTR